MEDHDRRPQPLSPPVLHVLLALSSGPLHGYGIMKCVEADAGFPMGPGTVYGALHRLEEVGWISVLDSAPHESRRGKTFELTPGGREALRREGRRLARLALLMDSHGLRPDGAEPA
jgi:DNA-binding PadR family transcriptional regulator